MSQGSIYTKPLGDYIQPVMSKPGINRDLPRFASESFIDGQHTRFDNGYARKMGGYIQLYGGNNDIIRKLFLFPVGDFFRVFCFRNTGILQFDMTYQGVVSNYVDRTPADWGLPNPGSSWVFTVDILPQVLDDAELLVANFIVVSAVPTDQNIYNTQNRRVFYGQAETSDPFIALPDLAGANVSGGVLTFKNVLCTYGNNGILTYSLPTEPLLINQFQQISNEKLLAAKVYRNGLLFWTSSELNYATFVGGSIGWEVNTVASNITLLSPSSIIGGHNNTFYWLGLDQAYYFNGAVDILPNGYNRNLFYGILNRDYVGKVWGMYNGSFNELWWFAPTEGNTECNRLYVYDNDMKVWSDSRMSRASGLTANLFPYPLLSSSTTSETYNNSYPLWYHEKGYNKVINDKEYAIPASFRTRIFSFIENSPTTNVNIRLRKIEKNINQRGKMKVRVYAYAYPDSTPELQQEKFFDITETQINLNAMGRFISLEFESNEVNGFFQLGKMMIDFQPDTVRPSSTY